MRLAQRFLLLFTVTSFFFLSVTASSYAQAPNPSPKLFSALHYRFVGPGGNRVTAVVGVPGNLNVYYAGAASGGVWK